MSWHVVPRFSVAVALLLVLAALPASSALGRRSPLSSLEHVPTRGGWPLTDVVLGRSEAKDYRGSSYLFFAISPQKDVHVSGSMLRNGGVWEGGLNQLFSTLVAEAKVSPSDADVAVLDVGANIGAFSLYVASLGYRIWSFEMQEMVYTLLELSRRVNNYQRMHTFHCALWNESGVEVSFTPEIGNFGAQRLSQSSLGAPLTPVDPRRRHVHFARGRGLHPHDHRAAGQPLHAQLRLLPKDRRRECWCAALRGPASIL